MGEKVLAFVLSGLFLMASATAAQAWPAPGTVQHMDRGYIIYTADGFQYCMTETVRTAAGTPQPNGAAPWITATFEGGINTAPGTVTLTLSAPNLTAGTGLRRECVEQWLFNLDSALNPKQLKFSAPAILSGALKVNSLYPHVNLGSNMFIGQDAGKFDIKINFASLYGAATKFDVGDSLRFTITGIDTLTAESFLAASSGKGAQSVFNTVAEIGNVGPKFNKDTWVLPEPATLALMGAGVALALRRRKQSAGPGRS